LENSHSSTALHGDAPAAASGQGVADRRELCLIAVERTRMPMVVTDPRQPDNPIVLANQAFLDLSGYTGDEVIGRNCRFLQGDLTCRLAVAEIRAAVREGREVDVELLNYRKDGSTFWNELHLSPIYDDDGALVYFFASQKDTTELRRVEKLEAAEHRLLKEVDHRTLNALSVVTGIVRLTRADDPAGYAAAVQRRIEALVRAHTLLAHHGWQAAPLESLIRVEVEPYGVQRVALDGPAVEVAAQNVQPLALVLHEMISNAVLHGALSSPQGTVSVQWDAADGEVTLTWDEAGGPPPAHERPPGFGSTIMKATLDRQLSGALNRTWDPSGLHAELRFQANSEVGVASAAS
jgi:PAS domain S-box-containing protein